MECALECLYDHGENICSDGKLYKDKIETPAIKHTVKCKKEETLKNIILQ